MNLSPEEKNRYARHLILPGFGMEAQLKLKAARVLVIGAGGLGSPLLQYLAAAGVGTIGIIDPDRVSSSNLQRQVLYGEKDLGKLKVEAAKERLLDLNPHLSINTYPQVFDKNNAMEILSEYEIIADGTDNFPTRYLVNDACVLAGKPYVYGSIFRFEGQVSVFNLAMPDGSRSPNYRDLYPTPPPPDQVPNCAEGGVLGVLPGMIGAMQANEVIKIITETGTSLAGKMVLFDAAHFSQHTLRYKANPATKIEALIDYEVFCGLPAQEQLPSIDAGTLKAMLQRKEDFLLLDVREQSEYDLDHLDGKLMPLVELPEKWQELPKQTLVVVHCQSGARSARAVAFLQEKGYSQVYNLEGGINAYRNLTSAIPPLT
ncbi:molybdopterin-synthase adenylyltransferase MoeB [Lewinella sp. LCG006]|uniref:molybdopterin-synthase adenylyltransferase MoeB n=1 Tax=Lewinella sp. LCG006 TaxID=3231911 RepID=UPI0034607727